MMDRRRPVIALAALLVLLVAIVAVGLLGGPGTAGPSAPPPSQPGACVASGLRGEYQVIGTAEMPVTPDVQATIKSILERRLAASGVAAFAVRAEGADRLVAEIAGIAAAEEVRKLLGSGGKLEFVPLPASDYGTMIEPGQKSATPGSPLPDPAPPPLFTGEEISRAAAGLDSASGMPVVTFELKPSGAKLFADYTSMSINEFFAIVLDGKVVAAPYIASPIHDGQGQISAGSQAEASRLVAMINSGALPLQLRELSFGEGGRFAC